MYHVQNTEEVVGLPFRVCAIGKSWIDEHHAHLMLDPLCEPSQMHESDLIKQSKYINI